MTKTCQNCGFATDEPTRPCVHPLQDDEGFWMEPVGKCWTRPGTEDEAWSDEE